MPGGAITCWCGSPCSARLYRLVASSLDPTAAAAPTRRQLCDKVTPAGDIALRGDGDAADRAEEAVRDAWEHAVDVAWEREAVELEGFRPRRSQ